MTGRLATRGGRIALVLTMALSAAVGGVASAGGATATPPLLGVDTSAIEVDSPDATAPDAAARLSSQAGAQVERMGIAWRYVQPTATTMRWDRYDAEAAAIQAKGLTPLIMIHDAPYWARSSLHCSTKHCPPEPAHYGDWANFAGEVALRYPDAAGIEIWNSPNTPAWWPVSGGADPAAYADVWSWAARRIHKVMATVNPLMPVLFGDLGSHKFKDTQDGLSIPTFLNGFYANVDRTALAPQDQLAIHAYPSANEINTLDGRFAKVLQQTRDSRDSWDPEGSLRKIWITESGISTSGRYPVTQAQQAKAIVHVIAAVSTMPDVSGVSVFTLVEPPGDPTRSELPGYGIVRRDDQGNLVPKQAFCALASRAGTAPATTGCPPSLTAKPGGDFRRKAR